MRYKQLNIHIRTSIWFPTECCEDIASRGNYISLTRGLDFNSQDSLTKPHPLSNANSSVRPSRLLTLDSSISAKPFSSVPT